MRILNTVFALSLAAGLSLAACSKKTDDTTAPKAAVSSTIVGRTPIASSVAPVQPQAQTAASNQVPAAAKQASRLIVKTNFKCTDGNQFAVEFKTGPGQAEVSIGKNAPLVLPEQLVASGFWYRNAQYELRGQGRNAQWTVSGKKPLSCTAAL